MVNSNYRLPEIMGKKLVTELLNSAINPETVC